VADNDKHGACPACAGAFREVHTEHERFQECERCGGIWLEWQTFVTMWLRMSGGTGEPVLDAREGRSDRTCPICASPMAAVRLRAVPLDHCGAHGVWFDQVELDAALAAAVLPADQWSQVFASALKRMS
jgi:Zn-finger nucleic acid-binding protein